VKENKRRGNVAKDLGDRMPNQGPESHVHRASRCQEGIEGPAGSKENEKASKKRNDSDVLWRRPSGNGEIGSRWYSAAMQQ
jgi:hypothetical protein